MYANAWTAPPHKEHYYCLVGHVIDLIYSWIGCHPGSCHDLYPLGVAGGKKSMNPRGIGNNFEILLAGKFHKKNVDNVSCFTWLHCLEPLQRRLLPLLLQQRLLPPLPHRPHQRYDYQTVGVADKEIEIDKNSSRMCHF